MRARVALALACGFSLGVHALVFVLLRWAGTLPDVGFEISLPTEIELGIAPSAHAPQSGATQPSSLAPATSEAVDDVVLPKPKRARKSKPAPPQAVADAGIVATPDAQLADAGVDAQTSAAGALDAGSIASDANVPDAGAQRASPVASAPILGAYAPEGAQLSLRLDMREVVKAAYADDVRGVLRAIPDFRMILEGSGIDPLTDIVRLFLASPNLERSKLVMAGEYVGGEDMARRAVASLANAKGKDARWRKLQGIAVAPWENIDTTERVVALIGPALFAITRPEDLPRILSIARSLAQRREKHDKERPPAPGESDASALLAMDPGEVLVLSVENAKTFVRGRVQAVPERAVVSVRAGTAGGVIVRSVGSYASSEDAAAARTFWDDLRVRYARHPLVALVGMGAPLRATSLEVDDAQLTALTTLDETQVRLILGFVRDALTPRPVPTQVPPAPTQLPTDMTKPKLSSPDPSIR